jgi:hypothetical protein
MQRQKGGEVRRDLDVWRDPDVRRDETPHGGQHGPGPQPYNGNPPHTLVCALIGWDSRIWEDPDCKMPSPSKAQLRKPQDQPQKLKQLQQLRQYVPSLGSQMLWKEWREPPQRSPAFPQD